MRVKQTKHLLAAFAVLGLLLAPVVMAASSSSGGASQSAAKHKPEYSAADLRKLKKKVAALEKSVRALSSSLPPGYSEKASTQALQAAVADFEKNTEGVSGRVADWEKNTEGVSGRVGLLEGPLGGVLNGTFPGNVQIVDGSIVGADIASGTITGFNVDSSSVQLRGATTGCTGTDKVTGITVGGDVSCFADLGSRGSETATSTFEQPRVVNVSNVLLNYTVMMPFVVTELVGAVEGQRVTLIAANSNVTVLDAGAFKLDAAWVPDGDDTLTVVKNGASWYEVARSAN
ncbi:MAG: hypothetical protein WD827_04645 [Solirubrobacterales bacterium]